MTFRKLHMPEFAQLFMVKNDLHVLEYLSSNQQLHSLYLYVHNFTIDCEAFCYLAPITPGTLFAFTLNIFQFSKYFCPVFTNCSPAGRCWIQAAAGGAPRAAGGGPGGARQPRAQADGAGDDRGADSGHPAEVHQERGELATKFHEYFSKYCDIFAKYQ